MKRNVLRPIIVLMFFVFVVGACQKDDSTVPTSASEVSPEVVLVTAATYTPAEMTSAIVQSDYVESYIGDNAMGQTLVNGLLDVVAGANRYYLDTVFAHRSSTPLRQYRRDWQLKTCTFTYRSVSSTGQPVRLSGRVTFPIALDGNGNTVASLSLYAHHYINKTVVPSLSLSPLELRALFNSAVVEPDFQGYGESSDMPFCGFSYGVQAQQLYDCTLAALEIMQRYGVTPAHNAYTTCWGASIAAPVVAAFVRLHDEQFTPDQQQQLNLHSAYIGGGPMILDQMLYYIATHRDYSAHCLQYSYPFFLSLPKEALEPYDLSDLVAEWTHDYIIEKDGTSCSFFYALKNDFTYGGLWPEDRPSDTLRNILSSDMFGASGSMNFSHPKSVVLMACLHNLSDWGSWMPSVDIYMQHATNDNKVPYDQGKYFYTLKAPSGKMHWKDASTGLLGLAMDAHRAFTLSASINMVRFNLPCQAFIH